MSAHQLDDAIGSVIAQRYRLDALLGRGAMGAVYQAHDTRTDRPVAVKVLHPGLASDPQIIERFTREAEAAAQLNHPNCVQVLAAGKTVEGTRFLVMPLLEGGELRREIKGGMPLRRVVDVVLQVLAGLEHAHAHGFIHRDVKPENVLLVREADGSETAKLVDFGLVKAMAVPEGARALTTAGKVFGTPWYMAPEQAAGEAIDARADLYAVGAMMFEMLTGQPPFDGDSLASVLHKHMFADLPALPQWLPVSIAAVIRKLMAKRAAERPASAASASAMLRDAVERIASQPTVVPQVLTIGDAYIDTARPASMLKASQKQGRVFGGVLAVAAAVLLASGLPRMFAGHDEEPGPIVAKDAAATFVATADAVKPVEAEPIEAKPVQPSPTTVPAVVQPASKPTTPVIATSTPDVPATVSPEPPRASGSTTLHKPAAKPKPKPRVDTSKPAPSSGPRKIEPSKPPRTQKSKLPGTEGSGSLSREGGKLHLRPSNA